MINSPMMFDAPAMKGTARENTIAKTSAAAFGTSLSPETTPG
jgi:hypothetical protein